MRIIFALAMLLCASAAQAREIECSLYEQTSGPEVPWPMPFVWVIENDGVHPLETDGIKVVVTVERGLLKEVSLFVPPHAPVTQQYPAGVESGGARSERYSVGCVVQ